MSDEQTFEDADDPLEHIEPDAEGVDDADDVEEAWDSDDPMDDEAPSG